VQETFSCISPKKSGCLGRVEVPFLPTDCCFGLVDRVEEGTRQGGGEAGGQTQTLGELWGEQGALGLAAEVGLLGLLGRL